MNTGTEPREAVAGSVSDPAPRTIVVALLVSLAACLATRLPTARPAAFDFDEIGYLGVIRDATFPMHHTLFLAAGREIGDALGAPYRGFVVLDAVVSALAVTAVWWWLRALVGPRTAAAGAALVFAAPVFWYYGAMAGNYTMIPLVGSILLGIAYRGHVAPRVWHPYVAAAALAIGAGYRQDIGTFLLPILVVILWRHRWLHAVQAGLVFTAVCLAWFIPVLRDAGGWAAYRAAGAEFAYKAGYMNSYWHLGFRDAPLRYAVKAALAVAWTFGPALLLTPRGVARLRRVPAGGFLAVLLVLSVVPSMASHLLVHFGVAGYSFHYLPALAALIALGVAPATGEERARDLVGTLRLGGVAALLAAVFLLYPTDFAAAGFRGDFDLAVARFTRVGLQTPTPLRDPRVWRTRNSQSLPPVEGVSIREHYLKSGTEVPRGL